MSHLTWHFITPSPSLGWLFGNMVLPRFESMWQGMFGRGMIADDCWWLLNNGFGTCTRLVLHHYSISTLLLPYRPHYVNGPGRARARDVSRSPFRHGATSPLVVSCRRLASSFRRPGRARTATCAFYVLAAHEPSTSAILLRGAPCHASPSTWATSWPNSLAAVLVIRRYAPFSRTLTIGSTALNS